MDFILEYAGNHPLLFGGMLLMFAIVFAYEMRMAGRRGVDLTAPEAVALINAGARPVDIRPAAQFEKGHILDARNIPLADFEQNMAALQKLGEQGILIYCENGTNSGKAVDSLKAKGIAKVHSLRGGLAAWRTENFPVIAGRKPRKKESA